MRRTGSQTRFLLCFYNLHFDFRSRFYIPLRTYGQNWIGLMSAEHFTKRIITRWSSMLGDHVIALIVGTLVLAAFMLLAALDPTTWSFRGDPDLQLRRELWNCLPIKDDFARIRCYDAIAHEPPPQPAKGANALPRAFGQEEPWR